MAETQYQALRRQGVSRRSFLQFCSLTAASLGLGSAGAADIAKAMQTKPRVPVVWLHGLECTCCTESFVRSYHPIAKDIVLSMVSLDYDDTIMAAAGQQAEEALEDTITKYKGEYIVCVEGSVPLGNEGTFCVPTGEVFKNKLQHVAKNAKAIIGWGSCAAWGCINTAKPNPSNSVPINKVI
ncbi:MAG TPA: [Ni/Fe] hydrogenase small subunit, partial [Sutterella sp.]|nr:[Ni/Fe] hydrogenase small subunit [Sutterella sp.]